MPEHEQQLAERKKLEQAVQEYEKSLAVPPGRMGEDAERAGLVVDREAQGDVPCRRDAHRAGRRLDSCVRQ